MVTRISLIDKTELSLSPLLKMVTTMGFADLLVFQGAKLMLNI
ncbi:hypothetical protein B4064_3338 [Caldibacillus thermoamylovorans]|uniref:Uncharacterized protein n=1 Tax=Caldibacillus thermoamylovorans TaxID=35841 RepID=A0A0D0F907_9BACI|nr:hypothetical protein B4064_3338 [Caldibacillus thermoamylovorans]KIO63927.1 hypothetical protein B4065_2875 [Caldibacillus thermoamylovorans]KIO68584.1 hypothetical protein B4166_2080 [Caldibacillus thermoamylovorans]KIO73750.1 hypothetical protein B4167_1875 [Caldibacillus thermoamylovorans]